MLGHAAAVASNLWANYAHNAQKISKYISEYWADNWTPGQRQNLYDDCMPGCISEILSTHNSDIFEASEFPDYNKKDTITVTAVARSIHCAREDGSCFAALIVNGHGTLAIAQKHFLVRAMALLVRVGNLENDKPECAGKG